MIPEYRHSSAHYRAFRYTEEMNAAEPPHESQRPTDIEYTKIRVRGSRGMSDARRTAAVGRRVWKAFAWAWAAREERAVRQAHSPLEAFNHYRIGADVIR
jgi:hypothetical protein